MADEFPSLLKPYLIQDAPVSMFYIPNFITREEEEHILSKIPPNKWITLTHRRLQAVPARLTASNALVASTGLPDWLLKPVVERLDQLKIFASSPHGRVNHCLINEYLPGQGIMPHEDGSAYHPVVATVSLSGTLVLDITPKTSQPPHVQEGEKKHWRILQEPRSLLLTTGSAYMDTLHGIAEVEEDRDLAASTVANWGLLDKGTREGIAAAGGRSRRETRTSLTFRDVVKVSDVGRKVFGKGRG